MASYNLNNVLYFKEKRLMYYIGKNTTYVFCIYIYNTGILLTLYKEYNMCEKKLLQSLTWISYGNHVIIKWLYATPFISNCNGEQSESLLC